jgi:hypothetical protein
MPCLTADSELRATPLDLILILLSDLPRIMSVRGLSPTEYPDYGASPRDDHCVVIGQGGFGSELGEIGTHPSGFGSSYIQLLVTCNSFDMRSTWSNRLN